MLCARKRADGTFSAAVKIREACKPREVHLAPEDVGFCCDATSTTSTTALSPTSTAPGSSTSPTPTTTPTSTTVSPTTTTTVAAVCGNNVIEPGEICDCSPNAGSCVPNRTGFPPPNHGGCPADPSDGSARFCAPDCGSCQPGPRCGNGVLEPGDACDYLHATTGDNCAPNSLCQDTIPCECSCAGAGNLCIQQTACCPGLTCVNSVCQ